LSRETSFLADILQIFTKNGFGKGFALQKSENKTEQNLINK